jgi:hypothetical protein
LSWQVFGFMKDQEPKIWGLIYSKLYSCAYLCL